MLEGFIKCNGDKKAKNYGYSAKQRDVASPSNRNFPIFLLDFKFLNFELSNYNFAEIVKTNN